MTPDDGNRPSPPRGGTGRFPAPDFTPGYPSRGQRIGPAWADLWQRLADGQPVNRWRIIAEIADDHGLAAGTVENLVRQATGRGLLVRTGRGRPATVHRPPMPAGRCPGCGAQ